VSDAELDDPFQLAVRHLRAGSPDKAASICREALRVRPDDSGMHHLLALCLEHCGQLAEAVASYGMALAIEPRWPAALAAKARLLLRLGCTAEAFHAFRQAAEADPGDVQVVTELAITAQAIGAVDEALAAFERAAVLAPHDGIVLSNLGDHIQRYLGQTDRALSIHRHALAAAPDNAMVRYNHALACLGLGLFEEGWRDYEWRWQARPPGLRPRTFAQPQWDGGNLEGRTILLHAEQGYGDTIQFLRFVGLVRGRGGRVALQVRPALASLAAGLPGVERVVTPDQDPGPMDTHLPMMSLPHVLGLIRATDLSMTQPYVRAAPDKVAAWHDRLAGMATAGAARVGVVWAGSPQHKGDHLRSVPLPLLAGALSAVAGASLFSLQKLEHGPGGHDAPEAFGIRDLSSRLQDFSDTAAAITALDLVITVDTAVAHLAGALGKPVWVLLPFAPDWRWGLHRNDSPWYPSMRLFRQSQPGDWADVLNTVVAAF